MLIKENSVIPKATHVPQPCVAASLFRSFPRAPLSNFPLLNDRAGVSRIRHGKWPPRLPPDHRGCHQFSSAIQPPSPHRTPLRDQALPSSTLTGQLCYSQE